MDALLSVNQCAFCAFLNNAFAVTCELCGDLLSPSNIMPITNMYQAAAPAHCLMCDRCLLLNRSSCTFCNAVWSVTPVGTGQVSRQRTMQRGDVLLTPLQWLSDLIREDDDAVRGLSSDTQHRVLTEVPLESLTDDQLCPVCLDPLLSSDLDAVRTRVRVPCCSNTFHSDCVQLWFRNHTTCPTCRRNLIELVPASDE